MKTRRFGDPVYVGDPVNVLSLFNAFEVDEMFLLDIGAATGRTPTPVPLLRTFAEECFIPLAYGGGLSTLEQIEAVFNAGYEKVVLNTVFAERPELVSDAARAFGSQAVVVAIDVATRSDCRRVMVRGGQLDVGRDPAAWYRKAEELGAGEILLTSIDREGTMEGFDLDLVGEVAASVSIPVVAHGGAGRRKELAGPLANGASAVAAGSLFVYQGASRGVLINYPTRTQLTRLLER